MAFGKDQVNCDLTKGACDVFRADGGTKVEYNGDGAVFSIKGPTNNISPTMETDKYMLFGRIDVVFKAAPGNGIISSIVLQSKDRDEIDWEWLGFDNANAQSNYFSKGNDAIFNRGGIHPVSNPTGAFHKYSIEWTKTAVKWIIDDQVVRTLEAAKVGSDYPQSPMQVKIGSWCAGLPESRAGTREWAGGLTDFSKGPFNSYYKSIKIVDYAGGDGPATKTVEKYVYGDRTGSWQSIKFIPDGSGNTGGESSSSSKASESSKPATTSPASSKASSDAPKTTLKTESATPTGSNSTTSASPTKSTTETSPAATTAPVKTGAGARNGIAFGGAALIAAAFVHLLL